MVEKRAAIILQILKEELVLPKMLNSKRDPFETLIITIISQNTADRNTERAFETLSKRFEISPKALMNADPAQIEDAIKVAGLYKNKTKTIKQAVESILEKYGGSLQPILSLPLEQARELLMEFEGVGPKTADVVLLFSANKPTIPVDTHVKRVAKRLGFTQEKCDYDDVRQSLQALFNPADYLTIHLLFIAHGRKTCKAPRPLCKQCSINAYCPSNGKWDKQ